MNVDIFPYTVEFDASPKSSHKSRTRGVRAEMKRIRLGHKTYAHKPQKSLTSLRTVDLKSMKLHMTRAEQTGGSHIVSSGMLGRADASTPKLQRSKQATIEPEGRHMGESYMSRMVPAVGYAVQEHRHEIEAVTDIPLSSMNPARGDTDRMPRTVATYRGTHTHTADDAFKLWKKNNM